MPITEEHELHHRRRGRNYGLGLVLGGFVALVFALTMVKVTNLGKLEAPGAAPAAATSAEGKP